MSESSDEVKARVAQGLLRSNCLVRPPPPEPPPVYCHFACHLYCHFRLLLPSLTCCCLLVAAACLSRFDLKKWGEVFASFGCASVDAVGCCPPVLSRLFHACLDVAVAFCCLHPSC